MSRLGKKLLIAIVMCMAILSLGGLALAEEKIELEVAVFQGGFGLDHFEYVAREYEKLHPNVKVNVWGNPRIGVVLRPRFLQGNPPDVTWLVREGINNAELLRAGKLYPLTKAMESQAYFSDKKWKDTILPSTLYSLTDGSDNIWGVSLDLLTWNMWYNGKMFRENGWEPPKTFDELLALSEKIKAKGIVPIAFAGKIGDYNLFWVAQFIQRQAGMDGLNAILNLEPGAWENPDVVEAIRKLKLLMDKGIFQDGAMAMNHTESQTMFVLGDAAMIACGSWLPAEMANITPEGFEMIPFQYPVFADGKGDPNALWLTAAEKWVVPADAKHPEQAIDFLKFLTSLPMAKRFAQTKSTMTTVIGSGEEGLPRELELISEMLKKTTRSYELVPVQGWYPNWYQTWQDETVSLLIGEISPEQYVKNMEAASKNVREDSSIKKFKVNY